MVAILAVLLLSGLSVILAGTTSEGLLFLEENAKKPGVVTLPSGLQYSVLRSGSGTTSPTESTVCQCHYRGTTIDGVEFDSSYRRGTPTSFSPNQVIPGWREALQLMKEGDSWQLVIPSELAYGDRSMGPHIKPGSVLVFELSLEKISSPTAMTYFQRWFGGGPPIWMLLTAYFAYILIFRVGPFIKEKFFPDKKKGPVVPLEMALGAEGNSLVYLDVAVGSEKPARIEITLFDSIAPKTAENFRALCTGEKGVGRLSKPLHFKGSQFHRIIPGFMAQGGDITEFNGRGGESIYGEKFDDELDIGTVEHSTEGLLSMANSGKNTNGSQFFITFAPTAWLNGKHVVFGKVTKGMEVVKTLESIGTSSGNPKVQAMVVDCGEIKSSKKED